MPIASNNLKSIKMYANLHDADPAAIPTTSFLADTSQDPRMANRLDHLQALQSEIGFQMVSPNH